MGQTYYLSETTDIDLTEDDSVVVATTGELASGVKISGTSANNSLDLDGAGAFDLSAPDTLSDIATVVGDTADVDQTITLRAGGDLTVDLGGGDDTVTGAADDDTIEGGTGNSTITLGGAGESYVGGDAYASIYMDASFAAAGGANISAVPGGATNTLYLTGGDNASTTIGSNIQSIFYLNVVDSNVTLDTGQLDSTDNFAPILYLDGADDTVTLRQAGETAIDYGGSQTITMAAEDQILTLPYAGNAGVGTDTVSGFDQSDTIDLLNPQFNTTTDNVVVNYDQTGDDVVVDSYDPATSDLVATETVHLTDGYLGNFSMGTDPSGDAEILFSGYSYSPPANPAPTQAVYYIGLPDQTDSGLVVSDGTSAGTAVVEPGQATLQAQGFVAGGTSFDDAVVNGKDYLVQSFAGSPTETAVWVSDGTAGGSMPLVDLGALNQTLEPGGPAGSPFGAAGTHTIFLTQERVADTANASLGNFDQTFDVSLWSTDGTNSGTSAIKTFTSQDGEAPPAAQYLGSSNADAFFEVSVGENDTQLWATDGTAAGTTEVFDPDSNYITDFTPTASGGFFSNNGTLYEISGTSASAQAAPIDADGNPGSVQTVIGTFDNEAVYAWTNSSDDFNQYFVFVGATKLGQLDTPEGSFSLPFDAAVQVGSRLVISQNGVLYGSDGSAGSLVQLTPTGDTLEVNGGGRNTLATAGNSVTIGGALYFALTLPNTSSGGSYAALYKTDGTVAGTTLVDDFQKSAYSISQLTNADGTLYFAGEVSGGTYLFRSDGTESGTYPVGTDAIDFDPAGIVTGLVADSPEPAPQTDELSASSPNIVTGTAYDDTFVAPSGALKAGDVIDGNGGYDRLVLSGNGSFDLSAPSVLTGISEVDAQVGGVSGSTQTITLRAGTAFIDRISGSSEPYQVNGADNSDTIVGAGGETFSGTPTTSVTIGSPDEVIEVSNAMLTASAANAAALIRDPYSLTLTSGGAVTLNASDLFSGTFYSTQFGGVSAIVLDGATQLSVAGGTFDTPGYASVYEDAGGNTISLGDNGTFSIYGAAGGDTITMGGALAGYHLFGTAAELKGDTIDDFAFSQPQVDSIDITDFAYSTTEEGYHYSNGQLTVYDGSDQVSFTLPGGSQTAFSLVQDGSGTEVVAMPCYCSGTRLLTSRGDVPVEDLAVGDRLVTAAGASRPINWIGHRRLDLKRHPDPRALWPVRVQAGAFGAGFPARDLWMSPGHNVFVGGVLIPARVLANGATVAQVPVDTVTYWHVELDSHDVILAEGLPAESYLDTGNRTAFENGGAFIEMHPDFEPRHEAETCAPIAKSGPAVESARAALLVRAEALGHQTTTSPDLHIMVDGRRLEPIDLGSKRLAFTLPAGCRTIHLVSRTFVPSHVKPDSTDSRVLGVAVKGLQVDGERVDLAGPLPSGWHEVERQPASLRRWTTGAATLPAGARLIVVDLAAEGRYWFGVTDAAVAVRA